MEITIYNYEKYVTPDIINSFTKEMLAEYHAFVDTVKELEGFEELYEHAESYDLVEEKKIVDNTLAKLTYLVFGNNKQTKPELKIDNKQYYGTKTNIERDISSLEKSIIKTDIETSNNKPLNINFPKFDLSTKELIEQSNEMKLNFDKIWILKFIRENFEKPFTRQQIERYKINDNSSLRRFNEPKEYGHAQLIKDLTTLGSQIGAKYNSDSYIRISLNEILTADTKDLVKR